ncbi:hypothetical protein TYRP_019826 [Tyrophagus putrescentiae]|nr:hypothetical protein TYRP_019826 [Tyrophagus putrescentiae]
MVVEGIFWRAVRTRSFCSSRWRSSATAKVKRWAVARPASPPVSFTACPRVIRRRRWPRSGKPTVSAQPATSHSVHALTIATLKLKWKLSEVEGDESAPTEGDGPRAAAADEAIDPAPSPPRYHLMVTCCVRSIADVRWPSQGSPSPV